MSSDPNDSVGSHYKSAREALTDSDSLDQSTITLMDMAESSSDYTFVSNMDDLSISMEPGNLNLSSSILLDQSLSQYPSEIVVVSKDGIESESNSPEQTPRKNVTKLADGTFDVTIYPTQSEFEANLPETVSVLETPFGSRVYLIGSAHFSEESMNDVSFVIRNVRPDFVMVELCESRRHILLMDEEALLHEATDLNLAKLRNIYQTNGINSIFYILLLTMSAKLTRDLGRAPGCEFRRAFAEAKKFPQCKILLGDRPINITINRMLRSLTIWETIKLGYRLLTADDTITPEEVEQCKQQSLLDKCMAELAADFPNFEELFVKERDMFMAYSLQNASMPIPTVNGQGRPVRVVGVVGIGHAAGIKKLWGTVSHQQIEKTLVIPEPQLSKVILKNVVKYGFYGLVCFGLYKIIRPRLPTKLPTLKFN